MSEVEVFDGKLIGLVAGMTNESCQLYERKECLKRGTICIFKCSSLLRIIYFFSDFFIYTPRSGGFADRFPINAAPFSNWSI